MSDGVPGSWRPPGADQRRGKARKEVMHVRAGVCACGRAQVDLRRMVVLRDGEEIPLTRTEAAILGVLLEADGAVVPRAALLTAVWGSDYTGADNVLDVHIRSLRRKLGETARQAACILTVRGVGYRCRATDWAREVSRAHNA